MDAGGCVSGAFVGQVEDVEGVHALLLDVVVLANALYTHWRLVVVFWHNFVHLSEERFELPLPLALLLPGVVVEAAGFSGVLVEGFGLLDLLVGYGEVCGLLGLSALWRGYSDSLPSCGLMMSVMALGS